MLWAGLATISVAHAAPDLPPLPRLCEPAVGKTIDGKVPPPIVLNRFAGDNRLMRLEGRADKDKRITGVKRVPVSDDEVQQLCARGFAVAVLDVGDAIRASEAVKTSDRPKTIVDARVALPTEFTIFNTNYGGYAPWKTYGNFWVPAAMPAGHTFQVVDFTVTPQNYHNSGPDSHLAISALTLSNSNLDHDFDGKGMTLWATTDMCLGGGNRAILQSWAIKNYVNDIERCGTYPGCSNPVYNHLNSPNSCGPWDASLSQQQRFLVGANIWQKSVYWLCNASACPAWPSPTVDSSTPYFRSGGAGVAFVHTGSNNTYWTLSFQGVNSYTNP